MQMCLLLLMTLNNSNPNTPIMCVNYIPDTDTPVPAGITYQYTHLEKQLNTLRCYCEIVKPIEDKCVEDGYVKSDCKNKTASWLTQNITVLAGLPARIIRPPRRNEIINIRSQ